jgi:HD-GYP domain-containing protein (c-di-GMP phosphodiesterase class II)
MDERITHDTDPMTRINEINQELDKIKDLDLLLEQLLYLARKEANADAGTVYIRYGRNLAFRHTQNDTFQSNLPPGEKLEYSFFSIPINDKSIAGFVARHEEVLNIPDMYSIPQSAPYHFNTSFDIKTGYKTVSTLTFPLISGDKDLLGVMQLINARDENERFIPFNDSEIPFFRLFANYGSKAIERAQESRRFIEKLTGLAEMRDPKETGAHVNRVGRISMELYEAWAKKTGVNEELLIKNKDVLRRAAMLHDVGKIAIDDSILKAKRRFTDGEYRVMKSHTWKGAVKLYDESELFSIASEVALRHHENWDGTGYPGYLGDLNDADKYIDEIEEKPPGLKGSDIPFFARIVAIADVYDALCSKRVYKEAWNEKDVFKVLNEETGTKFDPDLMKVFLEPSFLKILKNIRKQYPDDPEED